MAPLLKLVKKIISPIQEFIQDSRAVGITLLACTFISLIVANTPYGNSYISLINTSFHYPAWLHLPHTALHGINDGLMFFFFFLVGMEIKRELVSGELSSFKQAILPCAAAVGGMLVPALLFTLINDSTVYNRGWGIPMATDIAFSLGVASLLGKRFPFALKIFLMALAIIDDLGAIIVIAIFYSSTLSTFYLLLSAGIIALLFLLQRYKIYHPLLIMVAGIGLWYCVFNSGIHATIAGVVLAIFIPVDRLPKYEHALHDPVNFIILPLFALANTAIIIPANVGSSINSPLSWGIIIGLVIGKPLGITGISWLLVRLKLAQKPADASWPQFIGLGILAGIGFTMSIFITMLAFTNAAFQDVGKIAVLIASFIAIIAGFIYLRALPAAKNL